jgi:hypothetical protein
MARVHGQDNLDDIAGKLTEGFNAVTLKALSAQFAAAGPDAEKTLKDFYAAAQQLKVRENEFNRRAKPEGQGLKANLRSADNFAAIKTFATAKQALLAVNAEVGAQIAEVVQRTIDSSSRASVKRAFRTLQPA